MPLEKLRAVFDCNIFWQMFFSAEGVGPKLRKLLEEESILLFVSSEILEEVRDVLTRPETQSRFPQATEENVDNFLQKITSMSILVKSVPTEFRLPRDPKDECYINLAVKVDAGYIITRDKDLLDLMTGIETVSKEFRQRFRPLKIVEPIEFLKIIDKKGS